MPVTNVLFAERISMDSRESTSIERQDEALSKHAGELGVTVVGKAVDRSVSGDVDLPDRPALAKWLTEEGRAEWDELWVTTQDRLSRNDLHFLAFVFYMIEWGKTLVVLDDPTLDLKTPEGRLIAHAKAYAPAKELERIRERVRDSHAFRRYTPAWHGAIPPYGYTTTDDRMDDGKVRRVLTLDEHTASVLLEIRRWLVDEGETIQGVAARLNERGEPTVRDHWRRAKGDPVRGEKWSASGLLRTLTSEACLGFKRSKGRVLTGKDGSPLKVAAAVFDDDEWESLQIAIQRRGNSPSRKNGASPLLGIAFCGKCGVTAYRVVIHKQTKQGENVHSYYRCSRAHGGEKRCPGVSVYASQAEQLVEETFLGERGGQYVSRKEYVPGTDTANELKELEKRIARLREDRELGAYDDDPSYYADKMKEYTARKNELESVPQRSAQWVDVETSETYADAWAEADTHEQRRKLLLDAGVRLEIISQSSLNVVVPPRDSAMGDEARYHTIPAGGATFSGQGDG